MSNVLCTICVRAGSKGVRNKNIRLLNGKPLIAHTIEQAKESGLFDHIVVSSDSDEILEVSVRYGAEVFFKRPRELATDTAGKLDVIKHAFRESEKHFNKKYDYHVDLDATSPLRISDDIVNAFNNFIRNDNDILISGTPARRSPYFNLVEIQEDNKVVLSKKLPSSIIRRQDSPPCFDLNASIYIWKRNSLLNSKTLFVERTGLYIMPEERSIDIDSEIDFLFVEYLIGKRGKKNKERNIDDSKG